jgi:hypothetical protein
MQGWQNLYATHKTKVVYIMYQPKPKEKEENDFNQTKFKVIDVTSHYEETNYFVKLGVLVKPEAFQHPVKGAGENR